MNNREIKGLLSIQASLLRQDNILNDMAEFVEFMHSNHALMDIDVEEIKKRRFAAINLVEEVMQECVDDEDLRISLQKWFGQFDEAQICEGCGKVMWNGYSWDGATYCSIDCTLNAEAIDLQEACNRLKDADDPDNSCYYTEW